MTIQSERSPTENLRYIRFSPNLDSGMILSLADYRPFFSYFCHIPPSPLYPLMRVSSSWGIKYLIAALPGECLFGKNWAEMDVMTFVRIKKVIWDQLLATKA